CRLFDWQIGWLGASQNPIHEICGAPVIRPTIRSISYKTSGVYILPSRVHRWHSAFRRQLNYSRLVPEEYVFRQHGEGTCLFSHHGCESTIDLVGLLYVQDLKLHIRRTSHGLDFFNQSFSINTAYVCKNRYPGDSWSQLFE